MRFNFILIIFAVVLMLSASAAGYDEARVRGMMGQALGAGTLEQSEQILDEAWSLMVQDGVNATSEAISRSLLKADLKATRARLYAAYYSADTNDVGLGEKARRILEQCIDTYQSLQLLSEKKMDKIEDMLIYRRPESNHQWMEAAGQIIRANYSMAWCYYSLGIVSIDEQVKRANLRRGIEKFMVFTGHGYRNHPIVADSFLGHGLCLFELGRYGEVMGLLDPEVIGPMNCPAGIYKQITYLYIQASGQVRSHLNVEQAAGRYFKAADNGGSFDSLELWMAMGRIRSLAALSDKSEVNPYYQVYQHKLDDVISQVQGYGMPWTEQVERILLETEGGSAFAGLARARDYFDGGDYEQACEWARRGIGEADAGIDDSIVLQLRYILAAGMWNLGRWDECFSAGEDFIHFHGDGRGAEQILRCTVIAGNIAATRGELTVDEYCDFVERAVERFGDNYDTQNGMLYGGQLLLSEGRFGRAERMLAGVKADSHVYGQAVYARAVAALQQGKGAGDERMRAEFLDKAAGFVKEGLRVVFGEQGGDEVLRRNMARLAIAGAEQYLIGNNKDGEGAIEVLDALRDAADASEGLYERTDYIALRMHGFVLSGDMERAMVLAERAVELGLRGDMMRRSLAVLADALEDEYAEIEGVDAERAKELAKNMAGIYGHILDLLELSLSGEGGKVDLAKRLLARSLLRAGEYEQASGFYGWLLSAMDADEGLAVRMEAGQAYRGAGDFARAAEQFRQCVRLAGAGSEIWYEAKFAMIECYADGGEAAHAGKLLDYFVLRSGGVDRGRWADEVERLETKIERLQNDKDDGEQQ